MSNQSSIKYRIQRQTKTLKYVDSVYADFDSLEVATNELLCVRALCDNSFRLVKMTITETVLDI